MNSTNLKRLARIALVICLTLTLASAGCGGKGKKKSKPVLAGAIKQPPAVPPRRNVRLEPALAEQAKQEILQAFKSNDPIIRANAIEAMRETLGSEFAPQIASALTDDEALVRFAASVAAGEIRLLDAKDALLVLSDDADASVRLGAKFALHRLGDARQSHDFERASRDYSERTRADTALLLGLLGEPSAIKILEPMRNDRSAKVRIQVAEALWRLGDLSGLETLTSASISKYPDDQMIAIMAMAGPHDRRVMGHVRGALTADYEQVCLVAARAMGMLGSDAGYGVALNGAKSVDKYQRHLAALAFAAIGRADAQDVLAGLLKDPEPVVRIAAASAILQLH